MAIQTNYKFIMNVNKYFGSFTQFGQVHGCEVLLAMLNIFISFAGVESQFMGSLFSMVGVLYYQYLH